MKLVPLVASCQLYQRHQLVIRRQALDETGHRQSGHFPLPKLSPPHSLPRAASRLRSGNARAITEPLRDPGNGHATAKESTGRLQRCRQL